MIYDPELKAMSDVYVALQNLDESTQKRVVDWVLAKLQSPTISSGSGAKRGPKPGTKGRKSGRKPGRKSILRLAGKKSGPKSGSKRGRKPNRRGRPAGSKNKVNTQSSSRTVKGRGRPRKLVVSGGE